MSLKDYYTDFYNKKSFNKVYPNEYVIRIFQGKYPALNFKKQYKTKKILDIGMGDGRNLRFLMDIGFDGFGIEITKGIVTKLKDDFNSIGYKPTLKVGENSRIPFDKHFFDYLLSWNSCYYMGEKNNYSDFVCYLKEFNRVIAKKGVLIASVPMESHSIYQGSIKINDRYVIIKNDPYKIRNGQVMAYFKDKSDLIFEFEKYFSNFIYASIVDNCFGLNNHWHIIVCKKK